MLVLGALIGFVQGWFIAYQGIPAFIVTLAGMSMLRGIGALAHPGLFDTHFGDVPSFVLPWAAAGSLGIPLPAMIAIVVAHRRLCGARRHADTAATSWPSAPTWKPRGASACQQAGVASVYAAHRRRRCRRRPLIAARLGQRFSSNAAVGFELRGSSGRGARRHLPDGRSRLRSSARCSEH